jgi:hypothetical protein
MVNFERIMWIKQRKNLSKISKMFYEEQLEVFGSIWGIWSDISKGNHSLFRSLIMKTMNNNWENKVEYRVIWKWYSSAQTRKAIIHTLISMKSNENLFQNGKKIEGKTKKILNFSYWEWKSTSRKTNLEIISRCEKQWSNSNPFLVLFSWLIT